MRKFFVLINCFCSFLGLDPLASAYKKEECRLCPCCSRQIFPGMYIVIGVLKSENPLPEGVEVVDEKTREVMICPECAHTVAEYCGTWTGKEIQRFESAIEEVMRTGKPVCRNF